MSSNILSYVFLALAIVFEVTGTTFLQKSEQFTKLVPTLTMGAFYTASFYCLTRALKTLPLGIAYGFWGGLGIVLTAIVGFVVFKQRQDTPAIIGIGLIVAGVVVVQVFSKTATH